MPAVCHDYNQRLPDPLCLSCVSGAARGACRRHGGPERRRCSGQGQRDAERAAERREAAEHPQLPGRGGECRQGQRHRHRESTTSDCTGRKIRFRQLQRFATVICYSDLLRRFATAICYGDLLQHFLSGCSPNCGNALFIFGRAKLFCTAMHDLEVKSI